jgi:hypothetical protein
VSELVVTESLDRLDVHSPMRVGMRVALALMGAVPLLAPYELLVRPDWPDAGGPFFAFAVLVSAGAVAVSVLFLMAALAGTSSRIVFDRRSETITSTVQAPLTRRTSRAFPLRDVVAVEIGAEDWSDGGPTYHVRVAMAGGHVLRTAGSPSRVEADAARERVASFLATPSVAAIPRADG